jgi:serine/threonine-protein kinase HipA
MTYPELEVYLYGNKVGTLFDDGINTSFYYSPSFKAKGIEISPVKLHTQKISGSYINPDYPEVYLQLPGIFRDSLPDSNGQAVMNKYFQSKGLDPNRIRPLHRLAFIGSRGMGALEYKPSEHSEPVTMNRAVNAANLYQANRNFLHTENPTIDEFMMHIIDSASPVGGAKEKMLISYDTHNKVLKYYNHDQTKTASEEKFAPYLIKFGRAEHHNKETQKEYLYTKLAHVCGIETPPFELLEDRGVFHFLIQRFDRQKNQKIHMATASALLHKPHIRNGISYEELFRLTYTLSGNMHDIKKLLRQMLFNLLTGVTDDHAKNFSFLMDEKGSWKLSPAYDITYGLGVGAIKHKSSLNGKNDHFIFDDAAKLALQYDINTQEVENITAGIIETLNTYFEDFAQEAQLQSATISGIRMEIEERVSRFVGNG